jgi:flagellar motor switch protein FliG
MKRRNITVNDLSGRQKAAVLLMSMDVDVAAQIFQSMDMREVEQIALEITNLRDLPSNVVEDVIEEFYQLMSAQTYLVEGGIEYAQAILEKSYGFDRAKEIVENIKEIHRTGQGTARNIALALQTVFKNKPSSSYQKTQYFKLLHSSSIIQPEDYDDSGYRKENYCDSDSGI